MDVQAAICHAPGERLSIETVQLRAPGAGEVLIEIKAAGLCHSDYHHIDGSIPYQSYPVILGHEGAGIVSAVGPGVTSLKVGDHVVPSTVPECRNCCNCTSGRTNLCVEFFSGFSLESPFTWRGKPIAQYLSVGCFANYTVVREIAVAKIRDDAPLDVACSVGCGVITGVGAALETAKIFPGASVIVFGLGGIGLNVLQGARLAGARQIIGVDVNPRREPAARKFGATDFVNPKEVEGNILDLLLAKTAGGADFTFECVGSTELAEQALNSAKPGYGVATMVGVPPAGKEYVIQPNSLLLGRTVKGVVLGGMPTRSGVPKLVDWYMDKLLNLDDLITHRLPLDQINEGFAMMKNGDSIRSVVVF